MSSQDAWDAEAQRRMEEDELYCEDHTDELLPCSRCEELAAVRDLCPDDGEPCARGCPEGGDDGWRICQHSTAHWPHDPVAPLAHFLSHFGSAR